MSRTICEHISRIRSMLMDIDSELSTMLTTEQRVNLTMIDDIKKLVDDMKTLHGAVAVWISMISEHIEKLCTDRKEGENK